MRTRFFLLFLICFFLKFSSQIESSHLTNEWYIYKMEMQDGSKPFLLKDIHVNKHYYSIIIDKTDFYLVDDEQLLKTKKDPVFKTSYSLAGNKLITSPESSLTIEKLNKDSLILSQNIKGFEAKDLQRYYYIRKTLALEEEIKKNKQKDTLIATSILSPKFKYFLSQRGLKDLTTTKPLKKKLSNFKFNGYIIINLKTKMVEIKLNDYDKNFINEIQLKNEQFYNLNNWDFSLVNNFEVIKIPYAFESYYNLEKDIESYGEIYNLYSLDFASVFDADYKQIVKSKILFKKAIKEYQKNNYQKAIELFDMSYKFDPKKLDAYYNSAAISFAIGEKDKACKIWQYLKIEGQKAAEKEYNSKCAK